MYYFIMVHIVNSRYALFCVRSYITLIWWWGGCTLQQFTIILKKYTITGHSPLKCLVLRWCFVYKQIRRYGHTKLPMRTKPWNMVHFKDSQFQLQWRFHHALIRFYKLQSLLYTVVQVSCLQREGFKRYNDANLSVCTKS